MNKKELLYETVIGIEKLEPHNQYYIAGIVKGMLTRLQQSTAEVVQEKEVKK